MIPLTHHTPAVLGSLARQAFVDAAPKPALDAHFDDSQHLESAARWLFRAQDATPDDGVGYGYSLRDGWLPSYRETSGYNLETLSDLIPEFAEAEERATRLGHWLVKIPNEDGSISNPKFSGSERIVFDTGQVPFGLVQAYEMLGGSKFLDAGRKTAWGLNFYNFNYLSNNS